MTIFHDRNSVEMEGYQFRFVQELNPERDSTGQIKQFMPQSDYAQSSTSKLNPHGKGPFCRFSISSKWIGHSGVYALFSDEKLLYIGECIDLYKRYYMGYGNISPRNCFQGGQPTNCKINTMVLRQYLNGEKVSLYFYETGDYKSIENILLLNFNPPYNGTKKLTASTPAIPQQAIKTEEQQTNYFKPTYTRKYAPLTEYLSKITANKIILTLSEIEKIIGDKLPPSAYKHEVWWANNDETHPHRFGWINAGFEVTSGGQIKTAHQVVFKKMSNM